MEVLGKVQGSAEDLERECGGGEKKEKRIRGIEAEQRAKNHEQDSRSLFNKNNGNDRRGWKRGRRSHGTGRDLGASNYWVGVVETDGGYDGYKKVGMGEGQARKKMDPRLKPLTGALLQLLLRTLGQKNRGGRAKTKGGDASDTKKGRGILS